jgi:AraC-like DNA-binding protein
MTHRAERRRIDWSVILPGQPAPPRGVRAPPPPADITVLSAEASAEPSAAAADRLLRRAIELFRRAIGLERAAIFLVNPPTRMMVGSWGTGAQGEIVDEHSLAFQAGAVNREVFARAESGFPWTVFDGCPLIAEVDGRTCVLGRGWVACTPILGPGGPLGIMFNDTALTRSAVDEGKQASAAVLCALLGQALEPHRAFLTESAAATYPSRHPIVRGVTNLLSRDPTMSCEAMAKELDVSPGWLARTFKRETSMSVVDHRNEVRLARFLERAAADAEKLAGAALDAGFGSYAQFHRVFRARFGQSPREYLIARAPAAPPASQRRPRER